MALKRAKKAQRRKAVLAEKRKVEALEQAPAGRVRRAAEAPILHCLLAERLFEDGMGMLILARGRPGEQIAMGGFLLDVHCLGIKDVMFRFVGPEQFGMYMDRLSETGPLSPVDPSYARKLMRDLAAWAGSIGFAPHRDFAVVERMFGDVSADASDATFALGKDGKPFYVAGPYESDSLIRHRMEHLQTRLGEGKFDYLVPV